MYGIKFYFADESIYFTLFVEFNLDEQAYYVYYEINFNLYFAILCQK